MEWLTSKNAINVRDGFREERGEGGMGVEGVRERELDIGRRGGRLEEERKLGC